MSVIIGIDLGTSTTEASVIRDGKPVMILNFDGECVTPSVVGQDDSGNIVVGSRAQAQLLMAPERTVMEVKRKMGTGELVRMGKRSYTAVEISSMLLSYVRSFASQYLDEDVTRAVISVPAYFNDTQRQATVEAGRSAGFTVERIINEPTAAAMSYGLSHLDEESHILVYDLGGGTFDVTLLEMFDGVLEVKASSGDNTLGGKDFDEQIMELLVERFFEKYDVDLQGDVAAMARLKDAAVQCKIRLSTEEMATVTLPMIAMKDGMPLSLEEVVTRAEFEDLIGNLIESTHEAIDVVLSDGGISENELDMVLLVGGSTRIPLVHRDIWEYLGIEPTQAVDPDYAVAEGAAIQAGIIEGVLDDEDGLVVTDVNPYTLGVRTISGFRDDYMSVVIPRNVTIPVTRKERYYTSWDGQTSADIEVYQGEARSVYDNHKLGNFRISGIPSRDAGEEQIEVAFSYNLNGILNVSATIVSTGKEASIVIDMMENGEKRIDVSGWKNCSLAGDYRTTIRRSEKWLKDHKDSVEEEHLRELEEMIYRLKKAIIEEDEESAEDYEENIQNLMEEEG